MPLDFDGTNDFVNLGTDLPLLRNVGAWTMSVWVVIDALPGVEATNFAIAIGPPPGTSELSRGSIGVLSSGAITIVTRRLDGDAAIVVNSAAGEIVAGTFYHIAATCVYNSPREVKIFKNGVQVTSSTPAATAGNTSDTNSKNAAIGSNDAGATEFWNGRVEDARVYRRALSAAEIQTLFAVRGVDAIVHDLQGRWLLNEGPDGLAASGSGTVKDVGPQKINGTPTNGPIYRATQLKYRRRLATIPRIR